MTNHLAMMQMNQTEVELGRVAHIPVSYVMNKYTMCVERTVPLLFLCIFGKHGSILMIHCWSTNEPWRKLELNLSLPELNLSPLKSLPETEPFFFVFF